MKMKVWISLSALLTAAVCFVAGRWNAPTLPADFRDAPNSSVLESLESQAGPSADNTRATVSAPMTSVQESGIASGGDSVNRAEVEWVTIPGGKAIVYDDGNAGYQIDTFEMSKAPITVGQYKDCVRQGQCSEIDYKKCEGGDPRPVEDSWPVTCVTWEQAAKYAEFKNARLPIDAEWEYAAKSGEKRYWFPWGKEKPTSDRVVSVNGYTATLGRKPVCSKPAGNTEQGLCDMVGLVEHWIQDMGGEHRRMVRGWDGWKMPRNAANAEAYLLSKHDYVGMEYPTRRTSLGFRIARSISQSAPGTSLKKVVLPVCLSDSDRISYTCEDMETLLQAMKPDIEFEGRLRRGTGKLVVHTKELMVGKRFNIRTKTSCEVLRQGFIDLFGSSRINLVSSSCDSAKDDKGSYESLKLVLGL